VIDAVTLQQVSYYMLATDVDKVTVHLLKGRVGPINLGCLCLTGKQVFRVWCADAPPIPGAAETHHRNSNRNQSYTTAVTIVIVVGAEAEASVTGTPFKMNSATTVTGETAVAGEWMARIT
jgi:hypothetical protein